MVNYESMTKQSMCVCVCICVRIYIYVSYTYACTYTYILVYICIYLLYVYERVLLTGLPGWVHGGCGEVWLRPVPAWQGLLNFLRTLKFSTNICALPTIVCADLPVHSLHRHCPHCAHVTDYAGLDVAGAGCV